MASSKAGEVEAGGGFPHLCIGNFLCLIQSLVYGRQDHVLQQLSVGWIDGLRIDFYRIDRAIAPGDDLHRTATAGRFHRAAGQAVLNLFHLLLHSRSLLH